MDEQSRYLDLMDMLGELRRDTQRYQQRADDERQKLADELRATRQDLTNQQLTFWKSVSAALRQLSDWHAADEALARRERTSERRKMAWRTGIMIVLLLIIVGMLGYALL